MGVVLIGAILLIICVVCAILYNKNHYTDLGDKCWAISFLSGILAGITLFLSICLILGCQIHKQNEYEKTLYNKSVLEYRLKQETNIVGNEMLYNDIVEFNNDLKDIKIWSNSFWSNWFNNDLVADIDYIEIDGVETFKGGKYNVK